MDRGIGIYALLKLSTHLLPAFMLSVWAASSVCLADERSASAADSGDAVFREADVEFFEKQVRPILARRCYECHSARLKKPKGGLRLDSRVAILTGGDTGPAMVPGDQEASDRRILKRRICVD